MNIGWALALMRQRSKVHPVSRKSIRRDDGMHCILECFTRECQEQFEGETGNWDETLDAADEAGWRTRVKQEWQNQDGSVTVFPFNYCPEHAEWIEE